MSLFVGNISKKVNKKQFQDTLRTFGRCRVDLRGNNVSSDKQYAFVQFDNDKDAQNAKAQLHNTDLCGLKLNIEWSKSSGRFGENGGRRGEGNRQGGGRDRDWDGGRGRRDDRERSWGRRRPRSYSREKKRDSPDYTQDLEAPPLCKRDIILLQKLTEKEIKETKEGNRKEKEQKSNDNENNHQSEKPILMEVEEN